MPTSNDLVTVPTPRGGMPIARMRSLYRVDEVGRKLDKLPHKEHEGLRSTYERMLEKGPERFQVKPSGLPVMDHLYDDLPNFAEVRRRLRSVSPHLPPAVVDGRNIWRAADVIRAGLQYYGVGVPSAASWPCPIRRHHGAPAPQVPYICGR